MRFAGALAAMMTALVNTARAEDISTPVDDGAAVTRLAVLPLSPHGVPEEYARGLTETVASAAARTGVFETISPGQIAAVLAYEKRRELMGGCSTDDCYAQVGKLVQAEHLVAGSVSKVGERLSLHLTLLDAREGRALGRTERQVDESSRLLDEARGAVIAVLQPLLGARTGFLEVHANVPGVQVRVDDDRRSEGAGEIMRLAAGPHVLRVASDGFFPATADVFVRPGRVTVETVTLVPARETIEAYESSARLMRYGAYGSGATAVAAAALSAVFYSRATDDKTIVDTYARSLASERPSVAGFDEAVAAENSFVTHQALYLGFLAGAVVSGGLAAYLFLAGDDPDRYEEFHALMGM